MDNDGVNGSKSPCRAPLVRVIEEMERFEGYDSFLVLVAI